MSYNCHFFSVSLFFFFGLSQICHITPFFYQGHNTVVLYQPVPAANNTDESLAAPSSLTGLRLPLTYAFSIPAWLGARAQPSCLSHSPSTTPSLPPSLGQELITPRTITACWEGTAGC